MAAASGIDDTKGAAFLEWGSGQGMVAILAALLGYDAVGVEIDEALVQESRELARRYDVSARFEHGSYEPNGAGLKVFTAQKARGGLCISLAGRGSRFSAAVRRNGGCRAHSC